MQFTETEQTMLHMQEIGLRLNEMKSNGVTQVSIETYESLLEAYIELLGFVDKVNGRLRVQ